MRLDMLRKGVLLLCVTDGLLAPAALVSGVAPLAVVAGLLTSTALLAGVSLARRGAAGSRPAATGAEPADRSGTRLGPYTLLEKLGEGGMGIVYRARHDATLGSVAIKVLRPDRAGADVAARFEREVRLTAQLNHPNTVRLLDQGRTADDTCYYAMEYLGGGSLADAVAETGPMAPARVIRILDQIAGALTEVHAAGHLHRDIKPANIVLAEQGGDVAKLVDFGLVKPIGAAGPGEDTELAITHTSNLAGTPLYMSPEAITVPDGIDGRADLYALGAVGYYLLTGRDVFTGRNILEICGHHLHSMPVPPSERLGARLPADLESLILSCLEKDAARRPADAASLQAALRTCRDAAPAACA